MKPLNEISRMAVGFSKRWNDAFDEKRLSLGFDV